MIGLGVEFSLARSLEPREAMKGLCFKKRALGFRMVLEPHRHPPKAEGVGVRFSGNTTLNPKP